MKKWTVLFLLLLLLLTVTACGGKEAAPPEAPAPTAPVQTPAEPPAEPAAQPEQSLPEDPEPVEMVVNGTPEEPVSQPEAEPQQETEAQPEAEPQPEAPSEPHPLENWLPDHWQGRYVLQKGDKEVRLYCKAAWGVGEPMDGWLFSLIDLQPGVVLPEYTELGTWDGMQVVATLPPDFLTLSDADRQAEYLSMCGDIAGIFDALRTQMAPVVNEPPQTAGSAYDPSQYSSDLTNRGYGVYQVDWYNWTEASKQAWVVNDFGYTLDIMVVTADGRVFWHVGGEDVWGTARAYNGAGSLPEGWPYWLIELNGVVHEVDMLQLALSMKNMPVIEAVDGQGNVYSADWWGFNWIGSDCSIYLPPDVSQEQTVFD